MAPDLINSHDAKELVSLGRKIQQYQESKSLNDSALLRKFTGLGSTKTYSRVINNDLEELDLERQLANYRAVWALIESMADATTEEQDLYDDLTPVVHLKRVFLGLIRVVGNDRFVLMEGDTGTGKSASRQLLMEKYGQRILWIEATDVWRDNMGAFLSEILKSLGVKNIPMNSADRLNKVVEKLTESRICLVIDEGHHLGPHCLNTIKTLINKTPGEFILLSMPTLWKRIEMAAYEEARQLTGNRLFERIKLDGIRESDVAKIIQRRVPDNDPANLKQVIRLLMDKAVQRGNLKFIEKVIKKVIEQCEGTSGPSLDTWTSAIATTITSR